MITYKDKKTFTAQELSELFSSVGWLSANYPQELVRAMQGSSTVFSAWDDEQLVGLINVLDDGVLSAYIHYLLVSPKWQGQGTGSALVQLTREKYKEFLYLTVVPEEQKNIAFYEKCGFTIVTGATPMFIFNHDLSAKQGVTYRMGRLHFPVPIPNF